MYYFSLTKYLDCIYLMQILLILLLNVLQPSQDKYIILRS